MSKAESGYPDPQQGSSDLHAQLSQLPNGEKIDLKWIQDNICRDALGTIYIAALRNSGLFFNFHRFRFPNPRVLCDSGHAGQHV